MLVPTAGQKAENQLLASISRPARRVQWHLTYFYWDKLPHRLRQVHVGQEGATTYSGRAFAPFRGVGYNQPNADSRSWIPTMNFAAVVGTVVATRKYQGLEGVKLLIVQPLDRDRRPVGEPVVAADATAQAGPGELVFIIGSREAALALPEPFVPVDHAIVGIVDEVDIVKRDA
jgi:ethanolamine utilization protein EutN